MRSPSQVLWVSGSSGWVSLGAVFSLVGWDKSFLALRRCRTSWYDYWGGRHWFVYGFYYGSEQSLVYPQLVQRILQWFSSIWAPQISHIITLLSSIAIDSFSLISSICRLLEIYWQCLVYHRNLSRPRWMFTSKDLWLYDKSIKYFVEGFQTFQIP